MGQFHPLSLELFALYNLGESHKVPDKLDSIKDEAIYKVVKADLDTLIHGSTANNLGDAIDKDFEAIDPKLSILNQQLRLLDIKFGSIGCIVAGGERTFFAHNAFGFLLEPLVVRKSVLKATFIKHSF